MNSQIQNGPTNYTLREHGFEIVPAVLPLAKCDALAEELSSLFAARQASRQYKVGGVRDLLRASPSVVRLASHSEFKNILEIRLGCSIRPVRAVFFDKTNESNWRVPWHQDLEITVAERIDTPGFECWTSRRGAVQVQASREVLEKIAIVRLHLDDCDENNGALKVIPRSHLVGKIDVVEVCLKQEAVVCEVPKGGALLMRPLLLHSSSPATKPSHRRVIHIEYATDELPNGLKWFDA